MSNITYFDYGELPSAVYIILSTLTIIFTIAILFLNTMLWFYLRDAKTPSVIFIKAILLVSIPAIFIGLPIHISTFTELFNDFTYLQCKQANAIATCSLLSSTLMVQWQLAGMAFQRYCIIANKNYIFIKSHKNSWVFILLCIGIIASVLITYDVFSHWDQENRLRNCSIIFKVQISECSINSNCTNYITIIIMTSNGTICNDIIGFSTLKLKRHIKNHDQEMSNVLGATRMTKLDRVKATHYVWIAFLVAWSPWGLTRLLFLIISDPVISVTLNDVCQTICYLSFIAVALVYMKMDKKFSQYMKTKLDKCRMKRTVEQDPNAVMELS